VGSRYRYAYLASGTVAKGWFHHCVARIDTETGARTDFDFGMNRCVGEPIFAPDPDIDASSANAETAGWLLCEVLDGVSGKSAIAVFEAASLSNGPVAMVQLRHHLPFSFHGWWQPA
jgi:all-trans-8'-apo-beta-carotenal 15,15'-oxygenase